MSKTVVVISDSGRLIDVTGAPKEDNGHYLNFAKRLLGDDGTYATLDYGWNGKTKLKISGANGQEILLDAQDVKISGTLKINNTPIQNIIDNSIDLELGGLKGTNGEIDVLPAVNTNTGANQPRKTYTISISADLKTRITSLENQLAGMLAFDGVYYAGDGLITLNNPVRNTINVFIGTGLKWESKSYDFVIESSNPVTLMKPAVAVDCESAVVSNSRKPVTAGAVYDAIEAIETAGTITARYTLEVEPVTGNIILLDNLSSSSPDE